MVDGDTNVAYNITPDRRPLARKILNASRNPTSPSSASSCAQVAQDSANLAPKWQQNGAKMEPTWHQNGAKNIQNRGPGWVPHRTWELKFIKIVPRGCLGASCGVLGASWGSLGGVFGCLGDVLGRLGRSWSVLGASHLGWHFLTDFRSLFS